MNEVPDWLLDELRGGGWNRLSAYTTPEIAAVRFALTEEDEVAAFELAAREAGLEPRRRRLHLLAVSASDLWEVSVLVGKAIVGVYTTLKVINEGPAQLRTFLDKVRGITKGKDLHPALALEPVNRWLDARLGARAWRYDPDKLLVKHRAPGGYTALLLEEEVSSQKLMLLVIGEEVTLVQSDWTPALEA